MDTVKSIRTERFNDLITISHSGDAAKTIAITATQAADFGRQLIDAADDIVKCKFTTSTLTHRRALDCPESTYTVEAADLLRRLSAAGWTMRSVYDGEETIECFGSQATALATIMSVDHSSLMIHRDTMEGAVSRRVIASIVIILGNGRGELVADYSEAGGIDAIISDFSDHWTALL
jgi:hypothetical protein